jgi:signal transduction histidine kinase
MDKNVKALGKKIGASIKSIFRSLSLRTQLLLILLLLLLISVGSLTIIYSRSEEKLLETVSDNIDDITKAIQISVEELTYRGDSTERLKNYVDMLAKKGIREISILNDTSEIIASSNPKRVGQKEKIGEKKTGRKKGLMITARLGEERNTDTQKIYNVIVPVSSKGQNIGYIHLDMALDDYALIQSQNHIKRILSVIFAFVVGIIVCVIIANKYTEPIKNIAEASQNIADGQLVKIRESTRGDEIGVLVRSFNGMVDKLKERIELEEKLKETEKLSMIGQLSSGIAHEIRNPLNFLSLSIGHIKETIGGESFEDKEEMMELLDNLLKEIHKVNELIHNFLFLGKPITLRKEQVPLRALIAEVVSLIKDKIPAAIEINTASIGNDVHIYCDREYMRICLTNLIVNAAQAIGNETAGRVDILYNIEDGRSSITVTDTGKGITPEEIEKVFEPYFSTKKYGIGLGLAISKRFVEAHGGSIAVESEAGKGTKMTIRVPDET